MRPTRFLSLAVVLLAGTVTAPADVLYTTFPGGTGSDGIGNTVSGPDRQVASPFTIASSASVGRYLVRVLPNGGAAVGYLSLWSGATEPEILVEDDIEFDIPGPGFQTAVMDSATNPLLTPGITYWLLLRAVNPADLYLWEWSADTTLRRVYRHDGDPWRMNFRANTFEVQGDLSRVPEPSAVLLFGAVVVSVGVIRKRFRA